MKPHLLGATLFAALNATPAAVFVFNPSVNANIPDGSSSGLVSSIEGPQGHLYSVNSITLTLNLSVPAGNVGFTGDLYAYLQQGTSQAVLLNRPGRGQVGSFGYDDSVPISITFSDTALNGDIHNYRVNTTGDNSIALTSPLSGTWQPDGRAIDPDDVQLSDPRTAMLGTFTGANPGQSWSLYVADLSGGGQYRLDGWTLTMDVTVPEPEHVAAASAGLLLLFAAARKIHNSRKFASPFRL